MPQFTVEKIKNLKAALYNSCFHDATFRTIKYDCSSNKLMVEAFNPILKCELKLIFERIDTVFATKGNWLFGNSEEINSLTVEDDFSYLQKHIPQYDRKIEEFLYLVFQMFSGDEFHIVCKEVFVETTIIKNIFK